MRIEHSEVRARSDRWLGWLALLVGALSLLMVLAALPLAQANGFHGLELLDLGFMLGVAYAPIGAFIAWRQPRNAIGWLLLATGASEALVSFADMYSRYALVTSKVQLPAADALSVLGQIAWLPGFIIMVTFVPLLFPNGRLLSPRWRLVAWLSGLSLLLFPVGVVALWPFRGAIMFTNPNVGGLGSALDRLPVFQMILLLGVASVTSLFIRFRRSASVERQQIKWFAYTALVSLLMIGAISTLPVFHSGLGLVANHLISAPVAFALPTAVAVAILRYQLFDIDLVIRRTLVYAVVTALLGLVFYGSIILLQRLFTGLTGQQSPVALVASTLVIAALFSPLRRRVQNVVDRRFYRRKYDAQRVLSEFGAVARDETDIDRLATVLEGAVQETMQPSSISTWIARS